MEVIQPCITWGTHPVSWYRERVYTLAAVFVLLGGLAGTALFAQLHETLIAIVCANGIGEELFDVISGCEALSSEQRGPAP